MDNITEEEKKIVDELKRRTINDATPKMLEDVSVFYRFAKARDFNLAEAEDMLRKHITWRKEMQIDTILTDYDPPEVLVKYAPTSFVCFDKDGRIVRHFDCGRCDAKNMWNLISKKDIAKYYAYILEKDRMLLIKKGRNLGRPMNVGIYDFDKLTYANTVNIKTMQFTCHLMKMYVDNYPESIVRLWAINAPFYFSLLYSVIKQVIPKKVIEKIRIYGLDGWKEDLLEVIDPADLPAFLGGTKTDPDGNPFCETFMTLGRPIPKSYFINKGSQKLTMAPDAQKLTVKPFSKEEIHFEVTAENSYLEWEFEIKNKDIDFSLLFKRESSESFESIEIIPKQRIDTTDEPEKSYFKCENPGIYTMVFDNTYSWMYTKEVYYRAEIKDPKTTEINSFT